MTIAAQALDLAPGQTISGQLDLSAAGTITAQLVDLTGDGHGHHIPGTPMVYKHGFIPVDGTVLHSDGVRRPAGVAGPGAVKSASPAKAAGNAPAALNAPAVNAAAKGKEATAVKITDTSAAKAPVAVPSAIDPSAVKNVEEMTALASLGGKSTQKAVLKKKSDAELRGMDAEYTRRGSASGKIVGVHQLVKDEIAARGGKALPVQSDGEMKAARSAFVSGQAKKAVGPHTKEELIASWSHGYRYKGTSESKDSRDKAFSVEMHRLLSTNKQPKICGPGCQDAHQFLDMVGQDAVPQKKEMQRGLTLTPAAAERMFKPGKMMDMPVASWTSDPQMAVNYAKGEAKTDAGKTKVIIHAAPGAKGLDITDMSAWGNEHEVVTGGRFNVDKVTTEGGVMHVYVTQKDFSAN